MKSSKIYAEVVDKNAMAQFNDAMAQDFVVSGALMPDVHLGYSLPIGSVVATKDVIVPAWVGYDIGCGMCALKLKGISKEEVINNKDEIFNKIYERVPVGRKINETESNYSTTGLTEVSAKIAHQKNYKKVLGSLGSGNHFIEIGYDHDDCVWVVVHSGSRGVGHGIGSHYMALASLDSTDLEKQFDLTHEQVLKYNPEQYESIRSKWVNSKMRSQKSREGHFAFDVNSQSGKDYLQDLEWCLKFALDNRSEMMRRVVDVIVEEVGLEGYSYNLSEAINRHHNHATEKDGIWIHRKGATHAEKGMLGVIPGNMRDGSFIVKGKGNPDSLYSSSHGAGRVLGRKQAMRELDLEEFERQMGNVKALVNSETLDESPLAYKNIFEVMEQQKDLVEIVTHIRPLINIKG